MMSELEKLKAGLEYCYDDVEIANIKENAMKQTDIYNRIPAEDTEAQQKQLKKMLGSIGDKVEIMRPFQCDNGKNITIGNNFTGNYNLVILDCNKVTIGDNVMIGPNTLITSVGHPISPKGRREHLGVTDPVTIGNDVWIGGNVTILPGVTIGDNVVIGAGAVVTKDIPDNSLAVGVPARVIKEIENDLEE
ncbi:MAG: sugar O-acetyltransferase [Methanobrevibacter boviskoreani]|jgi:maltose O-acetyltransferase|uniref:sugar O-acetyltransferase n=1 Tax=Methanobrevibacter TaxID=2172 RepID=UPI0003348F87|nr:MULTISPECIES: sugar O-acetyltransferase [Methanobrevibacter]AGN16972.1 hexapeptide repeat-containing acetyltransferase [Methanobrevibacter sp. AbM4]